eukprot:m.189369 g.189369  ORF g.189369 m.189369 type:complete len:94 (-) comp10565_c0_seq3:31-312(-)
MRASKSATISATLERALAMRSATSDGACALVAPMATTASSQDAAPLMLAMQTVQMQNTVVHLACYRTFCDQQGAANLVRGSLRRFLRWLKRKK